MWIIFQKNWGSNTGLASFDYSGLTKIKKTKNKKKFQVWNMKNMKNFSVKFYTLSIWKQCESFLIKSETPVCWPLGKNPRTHPLWPFRLLQEAGTLRLASRRFCLRWPMRKAGCVARMSQGVPGDHRERRERKDKGVRLFPHEKLRCSQHSRNNNDRRGPVAFFLDRLPAF